MQVKDILHHYLGCKAMVIHSGFVQEVERKVSAGMILQIKEYDSIKLILKSISDITSKQADEMELESYFKGELKGVVDPLFTATEFHTLCKNGYNVFNLKEPEIILI